MINTLHTGNTTRAALTPLVEQIAKRADANKDGTVSTTEFADFLNGLLQTAAARGVSLGTPPAPAGTAAPAAHPPTAQATAIVASGR